MGATAGDILARDVVCSWLEEAGMPFDVAVAPPFAGGVHWRDADPGAYTHVVFVCGPVGNGPPVTEFLARFEGCRLVGVNLTMLHTLDDWNPFDDLFERDSSRAARPDVSFLSDQPRVPVVGLVLVHPQREYADGRHAGVERLIARVLAARDVAVVPIDTRLDVNSTGLRSAAQVESAIARMDAVVTNRLHGLVLALKNGVPAVAVDSVPGGAKVTRQAAELGWPFAYPFDADETTLGGALDSCLAPDARALASDCAERGRAALAGLRAEVVGALAQPPM